MSGGDAIARRALIQGAVGAAAAPVLLNVILVTAMVIGARSGMDIGRALVWGVPLAGAAQLALVWYAAARAGFALKPRMPRLTPEMRKLAAVAAPAALAGGVVQVNLLVGRQVASFFEGSIQYLNLADRLYQLPLGVVAIAIGVVLLPDLSRRLRAGDEAGGRHGFNRAAEFALFLTLPCAVALVVIPDALILTLFQRGAFTVADAQATALAVAVYGLGLPAFVLQKVLQPLFYAREDTKSPFRYAVVAMVVNAGLAIGLAPAIGYMAAATATTTARDDDGRSRRIGCIACRKLKKLPSIKISLGCLHSPPGSTYSCIYRASNYVNQRRQTAKTPQSASRSPLPWH